MYLDFYQMTERPFNITPDPKCLYLNARYREALASLQYGVSHRRGFVTLIGEAGTGKTTLLKRLLDQFDEKTRSVLIFNTHVSFDEILEYMFAEFDLPVHNGKRLYMLQRLNTFLLEELRAGGNVALLIDEAQDLEYSVLEDLRLLSNLETAKEKILQIVLSGQPELGEKLGSPMLRQLRQRVAVSCNLLPLCHDDVSGYVQYRLQAAGCRDPKLFSRDAEDEILRFSRGIPRLINVICDNALVIGYALGKRRIGGDLIREAATDLMPVEEHVDDSPTAAEVTAVPAQTGATAQWYARLGLVAVVLVAVVVGLLSVGRSILQRSPNGGIAPGHSSAESVVGRSVEIIRPGSLSTSDVIQRGDEQLPGDAVVRPREVESEGEPPKSSLPGAFSGGTELDFEASAAPEKAEQPAQPSGTNAPAVSGNQLEVYAEEIPVESRGSEESPDSDSMTGEPAKSAGETGPSSSGGVRNSQAAMRELAMARVPDPIAPAGAAGSVDEPRSNAGMAALTGTDQFGAVEGSVGSRETSVVPDGGIRLASTRSEQVVVQPGESVSTIAVRKYGRVNHAILDLLKLANPQMRDLDVVSVGQSIQLPDLSDGLVVATGEDTYGVLVYSTARQVRATGLQTALQVRGHRSRVSQGQLSPERPTFRVVIDGFSDRAAAAAAGEDVWRLFRDDGQLARLLRSEAR